jgi:hypothetical protein
MTVVTEFLNQKRSQDNNNRKADGKASDGDIGEKTVF